MYSWLFGIIQAPKPHIIIWGDRIYGGTYMPIYVPPYMRSDCFFNNFTSEVFNLGTDRIFGKAGSIRDPVLFSRSGRVWFGFKPDPRFLKVFFNFNIICQNWQPAAKVSLKPEHFISIHQGNQTQVKTIIVSNYMIQALIHRSLSNLHKIWNLVIGKCH